ncbi:MAG TPA: CvpA family protein [Steroidobacteraceae bacterium]
MNLADYLIILAILISAIVGAVRGLLREAIALATWILALVLAWNLSPRFEPYLGGLLSEPSVRPWVARTLIAVVVLLVGMAVGAIVTYFVRLSIFSGMDRFLGFVFGLLRGVLLLALFVMLGQLVKLEDERWWRESILIPVGESLANGLRTVVGEELEARAKALRSDVTS